VLRVDRSGLRVTDDLKLMWLHHSSERILEQIGVLWRPEVNVHRMQPVHIFALVCWVRRRKVPLRGVLVGTGCSTTVLASEAIDGQSEEA